MDMYRDSDSHRRTPIAPCQEDEPYRTPWRRDLARIIHSPAFRRQAGKMQLFPSIESDYFRTRLTHALEVAQIAKSIAIRLNNTEEFLQPRCMHIEPTIVEAASLVHDLGHPPFGHQGEEELDRQMRDSGGFEGNAQTLRILSRLEKRERGGVDGSENDAADDRCGLNLTARTLGAILKYDTAIKIKRKKHEKIAKGYYKSEAGIVSWLKQQIAPDANLEKVAFKTIECSIMDVADDIAYATYDIEDAFKAGLLSPIEMMSASDEMLERVASKVTGAVGRRVEAQEVLSEIIFIFHGLFNVNEPEKLVQEKDKRFAAAVIAQRASREICENGSARTALTSQLVGEFIRSIQFIPNPNNPGLSSVRMAPDTLVRVEVLKCFAFESLIMSPRLRIVQYRAGEIVGEIFRAITNREKDGHRLMPDDCQAVWNTIDENLQKRVACDFIAGMTDRYAIEFYGRLKSERPQTLFRPL